MKWVSINETPVHNIAVTGNNCYDGSFRSSIPGTTLAVAGSVVSNGSSE